MSEKTAEQIWAELEAEDSGKSVSASPEVTVEGGQGNDSVALAPEATVEGGQGTDTVPPPEPSLTELMDKINGLETQLVQATGRLRNAEGHIGGLNKQLKAAQQQATTQGFDAPNAAELAAAKADPEAMAALKRDYPEFASAMSAALKAELDVMKKQLQPQQQQPALPENLVTADDLANMKNDIFVEMHHEGWKDRVRTPQFVGWLTRQSREIQMLASSPDPRDAVRLLDLHAGKPKVSDAGLTSAAALPSGKSGTRVTQKSLDDMTPEEYWRYLDEQDRHQR